MAFNQLFAKKSITALMAAPEEGHQLKRALGPATLVSLGVGAIIGAGIFVLTGEAAAKHAGPAILLSFILAGVGCAFAGLCYAEMASMIPISGSAYTYSYTTMGEFFAWVIGWDLILEYSLGAATVSVGWSGYMVSFLRDFGIVIPPEFTAATGLELIQLPTGAWQPLTAELMEKLTKDGVATETLARTHGIFNAPAFLIVALITGLLVVGIRESAFVNNIIVVIKVGVLTLFLIAGGYFLLNNPSVFSQNWSVFLPDNTGTFGEFGWSGVLTGAGVIFFAYIGFDAVSTTAQESRNPQRDMPIGILGSLVICTVFYILVAVVLTGLVNYKQLNVADPVAVGIDATGYTWLKPIIKIGAIAGLSSVMLVMLLAQPRIFFTMSRDGLLPPFMSRLHPRFQTPVVTTLLTGTVVAIAGAVTPINVLGHLVSIGTLLAFVLVCGAVLTLRYTNPGIPRPFRAPLMPFTPILGILICFSQMAALPWDTWLRLLVWMAIGVALYFCYGFWFSKLRTAPDAGGVR